MSSKKIYLVRHGQTDYNLRNIVQGSGVDTDLNARGRQQAAAFYEAYKHIKFDKIYTSVLKRSQQSVEAFHALGIPWEHLAGLNEISWGEKEGQAVTNEENEYYHHVIKRWQSGEIDLRIERGESPVEVVARMAPAMEHIMARTSEKTILICMHGRAIRILMAYLLRYPLNCMDMFEHENLGLYLLNYTGSMFQVERYNDNHHLRFLS